MNKTLFYVCLICFLLISDVSSSRVYPDWFTYFNENNWIPNTFTTVILAIITAFYSIDNNRIKKVAENSLKLEIEPNVIFCLSKTNEFQIINMSKNAIYVKYKTQEN